MQIMVVVALSALALATLFNSLGLIFMKKAIMETEQMKTAKPAIVHPKYILGFSFQIFGALILVGKSLLHFDE